MNKESASLMTGWGGWKGYAGEGRILRRLLGSVSCEYTGGGAAVWGEVTCGVRD